MKKIIPIILCLFLLVHLVLAKEKIDVDKDRVINHLGEQWTFLTGATLVALMKGLIMEYPSRKEYIIRYNTKSTKPTKHIMYEKVIYNVEKSFWYRTTWSPFLGDYEDKTWIRWDNLPLDKLWMAQDVSDFQELKAKFSHWNK